MVLECEKKIVSKWRKRCFHNGFGVTKGFFNIASMVAERECSNGKKEISSQ